MLALLLTATSIVEETQVESVCEAYQGGGCDACHAVGGFCDYCPVDDKCANSNLKKYCVCTAADCIGQDCDVKTCPPPAPPPPPSHVKQFEITVEEIAEALNRTKGHPLENLIIRKILAILNADGLSVAGDDIVYDSVGDTIILENTTCKVRVQMDQGWQTHATLKGPTAVALELGVDNRSLVVGAEVRLDTSFHVAGNIHFQEGSSVIHPKHKKCSIIATENSRETIDGDMDLQTNVTLHLKPTIVGNWSAGWHLAFVPTVAVAGRLLSFDAKVFSHISVFGIPMTKVSMLVNLAINSALRSELVEKLVQKELTKLQAKLQAIADNVWPAASKGALPGITQEYLTEMQAAVESIATSQAARYP